MKRFLPWTRQRTGRVLIFRAYVVRASDRQIVRALDGAFRLALQWAFGRMGGDVGGF